MPLERSRPYCWGLEDWLVLPVSPLPLISEIVIFPVWSVHRSEREDYNQLKIVRITRGSGLPGSGLPRDYSRPIFNIYNVLSFGLLPHSLSDTEVVLIDFIYWMFLSVVSTGLITTWILVMTYELVHHRAGNHTRHAVKRFRSLSKSLWIIQK